MEPAIKNWRNFPPIGGWSLEYEEQGQKFNFSGQPKKILDQIRKVQEANGTYESDGKIWLFMNSIWCERDPKKCIRSMLTLQPAAAKAVGQSSGRRCRGCGGGSIR